MTTEAPDITQETAEATPEATEERDEVGRFATGGTFHTTIEAVRRIATHAAGEAGIAPDRVGANRFDRARSDLGIGLDECPTARGLKKRYRRPLSDLIAASLGDPEDVNEVLGRGRSDGRAHAQEGLTREQLLLSVKAAGFQMGEAPTPESYDQWAIDWAVERQRMGAFESALPRSVTLLAEFGDWPAVLAAAGVIPSAQAFRANRLSRREADPAEEILDRCIDETGILPVRRYFEDWTRRKGIPLGRDLKPWGATVERCRALRQAAGKTTPAASTPENQSPSLPSQVPSAQNQRRRSGGLKVYWTRELMLDALRTVYGPRHLRGARPTEDHYKTARGRSRDLPTLPTLKKMFGTLQNACREAGI